MKDIEYDGPNEKDAVDAFLAKHVYDNVCVQAIGPIPHPTAPPGYSYARIVDMPSAIRGASLQWEDARASKAHPMTTTHPWATWAQHGFVTLDAADDEYAAALMCTDAGDVDPADLILPAPCVAFSLRLVGGFVALIHRNARPHGASELQHNMSLNIMLDGDRDILVNGCTIWDLLCEDTGERANTLRGTPMNMIIGDTTPHDLRVLAIVRRYIIGLLLAYPVKSNWTYEGLRLARIKKLRGHEPSHRLAILGRKVNTDVREGVRRYLGGEGKSPTVQFLVRGHYRNQACGPKHSKRQLIWIQPHWKGPEDALILARPIGVSPT